MAITASDRMVILDARRYCIGAWIILEGGSLDGLGWGRDLEAGAKEQEKER